MPDTKVSSTYCNYYNTGSGGLAWPHRCRRWLATVSDASNTEALVSKPCTNAKAPMEPIIATAPLELLHIDFMSMETSMELDQPPNVVSILVFWDHFTKHIIAFVTPNQTAKTVAKFLWQGYISIFGAPAKLLSDWGANFESNIIKELRELMGIWNFRTSPYHAQTNGQIAGPHQMFMHMIGKSSNDWKVDWFKHVPELVYAYNSMRSAITRYIPHYLMFRQWPCLPIDFYFLLDKVHWETPVWWLLHCWITWTTVRSLQGSTNAVHVWGWETEAVLGWVNRKLCAVLQTFSRASLSDQGWKG